MSPASDRSDEQLTVTIPADIERPDRLLGPFTARQLAVLIPGLALIWAAYQATRALVPPAAFAVFAVPAVGAVAALALAERDGIGLDHFALHALTYARRPRRLVPATDPIPALPAWARPPDRTGPPPAPLQLPAHTIGARGTLNLAGQGVTVIVAASTVSFTLRTPAEQAALVAAFGGWLNSLTGPTQILVQAAPIDLAPAITALRDRAAALPHPALEQAAVDHARFLAELSATRDLLARRVLIIIREPAGTPTLRTIPAGATAAGTPTGTAAGRGRTADRTTGQATDRATDAAGVRALRRAEQATRALAAAGITATILDAGQAAAALAAAADPTAPAMGADLALPGDPITAPAAHSSASSAPTSSAPTTAVSPSGSLPEWLWEGSR